MTMNGPRRAMIAKELARAQSALGNAFLMATNEGQFEVAKGIRKQVQAVGETITLLNGGPLKISATELLT
jgi:hypothetical protein